MSKIENIKNHVRENKKVYIGTAAGLAVGAAVGVGIGVGLSVRQSGPITNVRPIQAFAYKSNQTVEVIVEALGDPGNIVQDMTTGTIYASQNQAAKALGVDKSIISRHLHGSVESINGHILQKLGKAAVV